MILPVLWDFTRLLAAPYDPGHLLQITQSLTDFQNQAPYSLHFYVDYINLHFSTTFQRRPTLQEVIRSCRGTIDRLTSGVFEVSDLGRENGIVQSLKKPNSSMYQLNTIFQMTIHSSSMTLNCPSLFCRISSICPSLIF